MAPRVTHTRSCTNWSEKHEVKNSMLSSRCCRSSNLADRRPHTTRDAVPPRPSSLRRRTFPGLSWLLLAVLSGEMATPVRGGLMNFSPPGIFHYGTCAQPKDHESFHFEQFNGLWYQVEMVPNSYMEAKRCITLDFRWNGVAYNVTTQGLTEYNERVQQNAIITRVEPEDPVTIRPYLQIRSRGVPSVPYHVVKTDYNTFACVYSCFELFSLMFEAFSILSRSAEIDSASLAACHQAFDALELDLTNLEPVQQDGDCLGMQLEGSGEEPEHQDEEEEEDENALATLTSEEVNQRGAPNPASVPRSEPTTGERETMMEEEMEDLVEEAEGGGGGGGGGRAGGGRREEAPSSARTRNCTEVDATDDLNEASTVRSVKVRNCTPRKPDKARRGKLTKGEHRRGQGEAGGEEEEEEEEDDTLLNSRDSELDLDDLSLYHEDNEGQGRGGGGGGVEEGSGDGEEDEGPAVMTSARERLPLSGGSGGVPAPAPLLLIALLSLVLWSRVPSTPKRGTAPQQLLSHTSNWEPPPHP